MHVCGVQSCPKCGAKQSHDEVLKKKKGRMCKICNVEYVKLNTWDKVGKEFFEREHSYALKVRPSPYYEYMCLH